MTAKIRPLAITVAALLLSNLLVGILGVSFLVQLDRHYSSLVQESLPLLNDLRSLAWEVTVMQRSINRYPNRPGAEQPALFERAESARVRAANQLAALRARELPADTAAGFAELGTVQAELDAIAQRWRKLVESGDQAAAEQLNLAALQPGYEDYTGRVDVLAMAIERHGRARSKAYSADTNRFTTIMLGIATWPLWTGVAILLLVVVFLGSLAPLLRRLDP
jgi:hypothetical protein